MAETTEISWAYASANLWWGCVEDNPEQTKYRTMLWNGTRFEDEGFPMWDAEFDDDNLPLGRVGKKAAGRLLDGREHNGFPEVVL